MNVNGQLRFQYFIPLMSMIGTIPTTTDRSSLGSPDVGRSPWGGRDSLLNGLFVGHIVGFLFALLAFVDRYPIRLLGINADLANQVMTKILMVIIFVLPTGLLVVRGGKYLLALQAHSEPPRIGSAFLSYIAFVGSALVQFFLVFQVRIYLFLFLALFWFPVRLLSGWQLALADAVFFVGYAALLMPYVRALDRARRDPGRAITALVVASFVVFPLIWYLIGILGHPLYILFYTF